MLREDGRQVGYLERDMAAQLVNDLSDFSAFVASMRRPKRSRYYGVGLLIVVMEGQSTGVVEAYARDVLAADRAVPAGPRRALKHTAGGLSDNGVVLAVISIVVLAVIIAIVVRFAILP